MSGAKQQAALEARIVAQLKERARLRKQGDGWVTARELACEIGHPWRSVSRVLIRLAERLDLEVTEITWVSKRQRVRDCFAYRLVSVSPEVYPAWLMPKAAPVAAGVGRVVRCGG